MADLSENSNERLDACVCPGCGARASAAKVGEAVAFEQLAGGTTFLQPDYCIYDCANCGLLFKHPLPSPQMLDEYYKKVDYKRWHYDQFFPTERHILGLLESLLPGSSVLDFGCSSGRLLSQVSPEIRRFGFEINEEASQEAARKGITLIALKELDAECEARFDIVLMIDVFEHLELPASLLNQLWTTIRPGGRLIVSTGNGDYWACRMNPARYWYFRNYEHLCMLTRGYASYLTRLFEAPLVEWSEMSHYDTTLKARIPIWTVFFRDIIRQRLRSALFSRSEGWWTCLPWQSSVPPTCAVGRDHVVAVWSKS